jgi:hypothetical protein
VRLKTDTTYETTLTDRGRPYVVRIGYIYREAPRLIPAGVPGFLIITDC